MTGGSVSGPGESETPDDRLDVQTSSFEKGRCLRSWKEIAAYLQRDPRTVQRWEKAESLPVHRHVHATGGSVYAFTADLDDWLTARSRKTVPVPAPPDSSTLAAAVTPARNRRVYLVPAVVFTVLAFVAGIWLWRIGGPTEPPRPPFIANPLTSSIGDEVSPSFSPDGKQIVFAWGTKGGSQFRIMLKSVTGSDDRQITSGEFRAFSPAWSPDGQQVAFLKTRTFSDNPSIWIWQVKTAELEEIADTGGDGWPWYRAIAWMPDGKSLIAVGRSEGSDANSLFLYPLNHHPKLRVTSAPSGFSDLFPAISPDATQLLFTRIGRGSAALYRKPLDSKAGLEQLVYTRDFPSSSLLTSCWDRSGQAIFIASNVGSSGQIWRGRVRGNVWSAPSLLASLPHGLLDIARDGIGDLVYSALVSDNNLWTASITAPALEAQQYGGMIASTKDEISAQYSPDGVRLAFESNRSGAWQIWVASRDGSQAEAVTHFNGPVTGSPAWSPDARTIVFDTRVGGKPEIFTIASSGGEPRQVTHGQGPNVVPRFSRDGRWIYFASPSGGMMQVWKIRPDGNERTQVTRGGGFAAEESKDGRWLFYTKAHGELTSVWQKPTLGGDESEVAPSVIDRCFSVGSKGIYFGSAPDPYSAASFYFQSFGSKTAIRIRKLSNPIAYGLALSPDEREVTYTQSDAHGSDLQIVRNIR